jgi:hydrogenase-1 operon protein HyaF
MKPFPIPIVALGAGSQAEEDTLDYLPLPKDMNTYQPPVLPEPEDVAGCTAARVALHEVLALLARAASGGPGGQVTLRELTAEDVALVNQVLGEGEASAIVRADERLEVRIQEAVFTGVWRVTTWDGDRLVDDAIEVGDVPAVVREVAAADALSPVSPWQGPLPPNVYSAPMLVTEVRDQSARWQAGQPTHVINLSLLPVTPEDIAFLDHELGTGRVLMLSRGYGNCRITSTRLPHCWRVVYYNGMDTVILNTVEVVDMPEVAMAAPEDLHDSYERLHDILKHLEAA